MTDAHADTRYLETFPAWLRSLGEDAGALAAVLSGEATEPVRRYVAGGLNYIFKSLDLIPDGVDDLGYLDDAFVLRVAAALAVEEAPAAKGGALARLAEEARAVRDFLGADYARLETYVRNLKRGTARGRTVDDILGEEAILRAFVQEVNAWASSYEAPTFTRDPKTLIKLKAFLSAKL
jgi:uncharacterized membrane protein YkvA (DUF1232 family)